MDSMILIRSLLIRGQTIIPFAKLPIGTKDSQPVKLAESGRPETELPQCSCAPFNTIHLVNAESLLNGRQVLGPGNIRLNKTSILPSRTYSDDAGR